MMRQALLISLCTWLSLNAATALATPVYLRPSSQFPSGHHPRQWLESRTKKVQFQRWFRVRTADNAYGWLAEDNLLTPLKLATEASVSEDVPSRPHPEMDSLGRRFINKGTRVLVLEERGSWVRTQPLPASENSESWIPSENLRAEKQPQTIKAFLNTPAAVYVLPGMNSRILGQLEGASFIHVQKETKGWLEIRYNSGIGFIRRTDVWTQEDLGEKDLRPLQPQVLLRSAPMPYADVVRTLKLNTTLSVIGQKSVRWGQVRIAEVGDVWWPINDDFAEDKQNPTPLREKLTTVDLFKRKIFDMASSPAIPSLKFASAQGIFRTIDGEEWTKIPIFQENNFPIVITTAGAIFIGPYMSDDHGETFEQWIRWDSLLATLKKKHHISTLKGLQILGIRPDGNGRQVSLRLNVGLPSPIVVSSHDQGLSWSTEQ